ncbi:integrase core domain-containing protein [Streptomyces sp. 372A]
MYTSRVFAEAGRSVGVRQTMRAVGSSADNALAESVERETLQGRKSWPAEREARLHAFRWLHRYNTRRRHSRLVHQSPILYEGAFTTHQLRWHKPHYPCPGFDVEDRSSGARTPVMTTALIVERKIASVDEAFGTSRFGRRWDRHAEGRCPSSRRAGATSRCRGAGPDEDRCCCGVEQSTGSRGASSLRLHRCAGAFARIAAGHAG